MFTVKIIYNDSDEVAFLDCATYDEAEQVKQSFIDYGKCTEVTILN